MIAKNSTRANNPDSLSNVAQTELNKGKISDVTNLLSDQIAYAQAESYTLSAHSPFKREGSSHFSLETERSFGQISKLRSLYGIIDSKKYSRKTQKWQGYVLEIKENGFIAKLEDITNYGTDEISEIDFRQVSPDDLNLVSLGAIFYLSAGYFSINGQIERKSFIRFRRISDWSNDEIDQAFDRAEDLKTSIIWE